MQSKTTRYLLSGLAMAWALAAAPQAARIPASYGQLPLSFEVNEGQVDSSVRFLARGVGYGLFLTGTGAVLSLPAGHHENAIVSMRLVGGNPGPRAVGLDPQATRSNYLLGNDSRRWHSGVANYGRVRFTSVYRGVDLVYHGTQRRLEYDFEVAPGADPGRIRLAFPGADELELDGDGELVLRARGGELVQPAPELYQETEAGRVRVAGGYVLRPASSPRSLPEVAFTVGSYDRTLPLIIDPVLLYSTVLGGSGDDYGLAIAIDAAGNAYVAGATTSASFPGVGGGSAQVTSGGGYDAFVTKINAAGTAIVYSTYLGGSGADVANGIAVDGAGNAYVTGSTSSSTFPGVTASSLRPLNAGGPNDAFVTKLGPDGATIVYSTFLGLDGDDQGLAIAVDGAGSAYVTGMTSAPQPTSGPPPVFPGITASSIQPTYGGGLHDGFVIKLDPAGTAIVYSTYLGGASEDFGQGIAVDGAGAAYVTGSTKSTSFPGVTAGSIQPAIAAAPGEPNAFVTKINPAGTAIAYSTYLGNGDGQGHAIAVDAAGSAYVTGYTSASAFPGVGGSSLQPSFGGGFSDAFVTKIDAAGAAIVYSTFLGGAGDDYGQGIAVDGLGSAYVIGSTSSASFPGIDSSSIQPANAGETDAFVTKLDPAGAAIGYSTFLGGSGNELGLAIAVDGSGNAYVAGETTSAVLPWVAPGSIQAGPGGGSFDAFVAKIGEASGCIPSPTTLCLASGAGSPPRFEIQVRYRTAQDGGLAGDGQAVPLSGLGVSQGGLFWFFGADNPEMLVKIVDGCAVNHKIWFFSSADTNVGLTTTVTDTATGAHETYTNPDLTAAAPVQDVNAFDCDANGANGVNGTESAGIGSRSVAPGARTSGMPDDRRQDASKSCASDDTTLCIGERFAIRVAYDTAEGGGLAGNGHAVPLASLGIGRGGLFWLFAPANPEMLVKVLDGCAVDNEFWVYYAAGTNVGLTVTVTDLQSGLAKVYRNADGTPAAPVQDTTAFACP